MAPGVHHGGDELDLAEGAFFAQVVRGGPEALTLGAEEGGVSLALDERPIPDGGGVHRDAEDTKIAAVEGDDVPRRFGVAGLELDVGEVVEANPIDEDWKFILPDGATGEVKNRVLHRGDLRVIGEHFLGDDSGVVAELLVEGVAGLGELLHGGEGLRDPGLLTHLAKGGKQDADQQHDDADHHQKFGDRECSTGGGRTKVDDGGGGLNRHAR